MKPEILLAMISKQYLQMNNVYRYKMKKVDDMPDSELIRVCHWYCEDNNQTADFDNYRNEKESEYRYCDIIQEYIDEGLCIDIQMICSGYIKKAAMPDYDIDYLESESKCKECRYSLQQLQQI